ncbi:MAG: PAS domain S-box protein [Anaerolineae bacterium]
MSPSPRQSNHPARPGPRRTATHVNFLLRSYKVLSQFNQALARATAEQELLHAACRVVVEEGDYRLAWIGYAEQDAQRSVRPVAQKGFEVGYLETAGITWADTERGHGPTGTAICTARPCIMRNIREDPSFAPWRQAALTRGYASSISLPLLNDGVAFGAFNIYAAEPDAFDAPEVELLTELAGDLSFGITALRSRAERDRAEQAQRASEASYRRIVETANEGILTMDENDYTTFVNPQMCRMLGYAAEEMLGKHASTFMFPDDWTDHQMQMWARQQRVATQYERRFRRKDGSVLWTQVSGTPILDQDNRFCGSFAMFSDITEHKQAEEAMQQSERRFSQVFHFSPIATSITAMEDGYFVDVNESWLRLFGYTRSEVIGNTAFRLNLWAHPEERGEMIRRLVANGEVRGSEYVFQTKEGQTREILLFAQVIELNDQQYNLSQVYDITERKRAEAVQRQSAEEIASLHNVARQVGASLSLDQVVRAALDGAFDAIRPDMALLFLRQNDRLLLQGLAPADWPEAQSQGSIHRVGECLCGLAASTGQALYSADILHDACCTAAECREAGLHSFAALPLLHGDVVLGVLGIASRTPRDFAERAPFLETLAGAIAIGIHNATLHQEVQKYAAELEQRVAERTAELYVAMGRAQEADRLKSAFLATMSHELRTPLNSIIGFTGIILQGLAGPLNEEQAKQLGMVQSSARHLLALINDVLDISKIEAGQLEFKLESLNVRETIAHVIRTVKPLAEKKQLVLRAEIAPEVDRVTSDRRRIEQVLLNLLNNAIKFTDEGEVLVACSLDDRGLLTRVIDTGIGIQPRDLDKLFLPFRQVESGLTRRHEGTGLGLAICKRLVEMLGGRIWVESEWGVGSVFAFTLPLDAKDQK